VKARSGLTALVEGVREFFEAQAVPATAWLGIRRRFQQITEGPRGGSRVVFILGDYDGGAEGKPLKCGTLESPRNNREEYNPRALVRWPKAVTISIWGVDPDQVEDEEAQIEATEALFEATVQAVHNATVIVDTTTVPPTRVNVGLADVVWGDVFVVAPPWEGAFGRELLVHLELRGPLFDLDFDVAFPSPRVNRGPIT
jgi:hypothetical protein